MTEEKGELGVGEKMPTREDVGDDVVLPPLMLGEKGCVVLHEEASEVAGAVFVYGLFLGAKI